MSQASAKFHFDARRQSMVIRLEGTILLDQVQDLQALLKLALRFQARRWVLDLGHLDLISNRGLYVLKKFAQILQKRGYGVEIEHIHPVVFQLFKASRVLGYFSWPAPLQPQTGHRVKARAA